MARQESPEPSSREVTERMRRTKQRDTPMELAVRSELHRRGLRYFVDRPVKGVSRARPDLLFPTEKIAVFIDGCFWHSCPQHRTMPAANAQWWEEKLASNVTRDRRHDREFKEAGWTVLRFWEHEDPMESADQIQVALRSRRS